MLWCQHFLDSDTQRRIFWFGESASLRIYCWLLTPVWILYSIVRSIRCLGSNSCCCSARGVGAPCRRCRVVLSRKRLVWGVALSPLPYGTLWTGQPEGVKSRCARTMPYKRPYDSMGCVFLDKARKLYQFNALGEKCISLEQLKFTLSY